MRGTKATKKNTKKNTKKTTKKTTKGAKKKTTGAKATTVAGYLASLPADRRKEIVKVRQLVREHLPAGYEEAMGWGMISYGIPLSRYPNTYNGQPLCIAGLAANKRDNTLFLMGAYASPTRYEALKSAFAAAGKKFDMGKSCLHFKRADDLVLEAVASVLSATPPDKYIQYFEENRRPKR